MTNHPNRSQSFDIVSYTNGKEDRPWYIRVNPGCLYWPDLVFPFQPSRAINLQPPRRNTEEMERVVRAAARAALKAAATYYRHYRHDDTFSPSLALLNADQEVIHQIPVEWNPER